MPLERVVLTPREVAELTGMSLATIYRKMKAGALPVVQMDGGRRFIAKKPFLAMFGIDKPEL